MADPSGTASLQCLVPERARPPSDLNPHSRRDQRNGPSSGQELAVVPLSVKMK